MSTTAGDEGHGGGKEVRTRRLPLAPIFIIKLCLTDHHDLKVGIILHTSSWLSWATFDPLKMMVDHLVVTLLFSDGWHGPQFLRFFLSHKH